MITWDAPVEKDYPSECKIKYRVRLLKAADNQFYRSKKLLSDTKEQIPEGFLKPEDIPITYVKDRMSVLGLNRHRTTQFQLSLNLKHSGF